jgi:hypothetical protein
MNNQQIEQYRKILADVPDGETHYRPSSEKEMQYDSLGFVIQDLDNIKTIVEQAERIKELETYNLGLANESCAQQKRIAELEQVIENDYRESSTYALSIYNNYYKQRPDAVTFELCDTSAGVVTQIDNMVTGVITELEKQLQPDLFWDANNTETSFDSVDELMQARFEDGATLGDVVEVQRATLLPNETHVFTKIDDEDYSFEYLKHQVNKMRQQAKG